MSNSLDVQVGGDHYKNLGIQPVQYMHANKMGYIEGAIVKYITRFRGKGQKEDLLKIKHFVDLLIDLEYPEPIKEKLFCSPEKVLDGADMNQDIHQLIGYMVSIGWTEKEMPSSHCAEVALYFLKKYPQVKLSNPESEESKLVLEWFDLMKKDEGNDQAEMIQELRDEISRLIAKQEINPVDVVEVSKNEQFATYEKKKKTKKEYSEHPPQPINEYMD